MKPMFPLTLAAAVSTLLISSSSLQAADTDNTDGVTSVINNMTVAVPMVAN